MNVIILRLEMILILVTTILNDTMNLLIDCREHPLGSIIKVTIDYQGRKDVFEIPLLKDPTLSYNKLEQKLLSEFINF